MDELMKQSEREQVYRTLMEKAQEQAPQEQQPPPVSPVEASFYFPWEYSPYRANGTTSAEDING